MLNLKPPFCGHFLRFNPFEILEKIDPAAENPFGHEAE